MVGDIHFLFWEVSPMGLLLLSTALIVVGCGGLYWSVRGMRESVRRIRALRK